MTGVIAPKTLTVTNITAANKPWDGNTIATLNTSGATLNGIISPDVVTLSRCAERPARSRAVLSGHGRCKSLG